MKQKVMFAVLILSVILLTACNMPAKPQQVFIPPTAVVTAEPYVFITVIPFWNEEQGVGAKIITKAENGAVANTIKYVILVNGQPYEEGNLKVGEGTFGIDPNGVTNFQILINGDPVTYGENGQVNDPVNKRIP